MRKFKRIVTESPPNSIKNGSPITLPKIEQNAIYKKVHAHESGFAPAPRTAEELAGFKKKQKEKFNERVKKDSKYALKQVERQISINRSRLPDLTEAAKETASIRHLFFGAGPTEAEFISSFQEMGQRYSDNYGFPKALAQMRTQNWLLEKEYFSALFAEYFAIYQNQLFVDTRRKTRHKFVIAVLMILYKDCFKISYSATMRYFNIPATQLRSAQSTIKRIKNDAALSFRLTIICAALIDWNMTIKQVNLLKKNK